MTASQYADASAVDGGDIAKYPAVVDDCALDDLLDNVLGDLVSDQSPPGKCENRDPAERRMPKSEAAPGQPRGVEAVPGAAADPATEETTAMLEEEFAKQLAAGMEELVQSMGESEHTGNFQKTVEQMIKQLTAKGSEEPVPPSPFSSVESASIAGSAPSSSAAADPAETGTFQDKVNKTLNKLRSSSSQVGTELAQDSPDDLLADMMRQMGDVADLGDMDNLLEGMMEQLTSKDILYDPLVDLSKKYPQWLEKNKDKVSAEDYSRYQRQLSVIRAIIKEYERPGFENGPALEEDTKRIVELMQAMQESGQPPREILEELAPGIELGEDGQPKLDEGAGCSIM